MSRPPPTGNTPSRRCSRAAYRLEIAQTGFKTYVEEFDLFVSQALRVDVALQVGAPSEQVLVKAPSVALERDSTAVGTIVDNRQVTGLPLDGRNFLELACSSPGAAPAAQGSAGSVRGDFAFNVNGAREDANNFLLDGVYNVDPKLNTFGVQPPVDAIREFEVLDEHLRRLVRAHSAGRRSTSCSSRARTRFTARPMSSSATGRSTRATSSRRATSRARATSATSSASRSAARSSKDRLSSSATTKARGSAKASRA